MYSQSEARALSPHFVHILCYSLLMHYNPSKRLAGQVIYNFTKQLPFYYLVAALVILRIIVIYFS